jgi:hypothetical protein
VARVNVEARASRNGTRAIIFVSVTDDTGKPITDLSADDLFVRAVGSVAGGPGVTMAGVVPKGEGIYAMEILPAGPPWPPGEHVLAIAVRRVFDRGQTLAVLTIPRPVDH